MDRIFDITLTIDPGMLLYPGDAPPEIHREQLNIGGHIGTHVDAPSHFLIHGTSLDQIPLNHFCGDAVVLDLPDLPFIDAPDLASLEIPPGLHILLKTRNCVLIGSTEFEPDYCYVAPAAMERLLSFDPLSIGIDYYSLDPVGEAFPAHAAVARRGLPAFVCLDLRNVEPGRYHLAALPLRVKGMDGCPVRAVLS